jgi:hypothetical protein
MIEFLVYLYFGKCVGLTSTACDLIKASLFTCGRRKSVKTTSAQKLRSADGPMTVACY